jgi:hypothetical protein
MGVGWERKAEHVYIHAADDHEYVRGWTGIREKQDKHGYLPTMVYDRAS